MALELPNMAKMHIFNCEAVGKSWSAGLGLLEQPMMRVGLDFQEFESSAEKPAQEIEKERKEVPCAASAFPLRACYRVIHRFFHILDGSVQGGVGASKIRQVGLLRAIQYFGKWKTLVINIDKFLISRDNIFHPEIPGFAVAYW